MSRFPRVLELDQNGTVSFENIRDAVIAVCDVTWLELRSFRKKHTRPRQLLMYLVRRDTTLSLPKISKKIGYRDHTTVRHATKRVEEMIQTGDTEMCEWIRLARKQY